MPKQKVYSHGHAMAGRTKMSAKASKTPARAEDAVLDQRALAAHEKPSAKPKRHKWNQSAYNVGVVRTCEHCGLKSKLGERVSKGPHAGRFSNTLIDLYLINGKWVELKRAPTCGKATKPCPLCEGKGVVHGDPLAEVHAILDEAEVDHDPYATVASDTYDIRRIRKALPKGLRR